MISRGEIMLKKIIVLQSLSGRASGTAKVFDDKIVFSDLHFTKAVIYKDGFFVYGKDDVPPIGDWDIMLYNGDELICFGSTRGTVNIVELTDKYTASRTKTNEVINKLNSDGNSEKNFYRKIKPVIDEMFVCYPAEDELQSIIEGSSFVRVNQSDNTYVVGVIREGDEVKYICYGVPALSGDVPPEDVREFCQWIPTKNNGGYYMIFQDGKTGRTVKNQP